MEGGLRAVMQCGENSEQDRGKKSKSKSKSRQTETQDWGLGWDGVGIGPVKLGHWDDPRKRGRVD